MFPFIRQLSPTRVVKVNLPTKSEYQLDENKMKSNKGGGRLQVLSHPEYYPGLTSAYVNSDGTVLQSFQNGKLFVTLNPDDKQGCSSENIIELRAKLQQYYKTLNISGFCSELYKYYLSKEIDHNVIYVPHQQTVELVKNNKLKELLASYANFKKNTIIMCVYSDQDTPFILLLQNYKNPKFEAFWIVLASIKADIRQIYSQVKKLISYQTTSRSTYSMQGHNSVIMKVFQGILLTQNTKDDLAQRLECIQLRSSISIKDTTCPFTTFFGLQQSIAKSKFGTLTSNKF